jgi:hypothetical protein
MKTLAHSRSAALFTLFVLGSLLVSRRDLTAGRPAQATPQHVVSVKDSPGWRPLVDPESSSVAIGRRRNAPLVEKPFHGGAPGLDGLGRAVLRDLHGAHGDSLLALCVTDDEFRDILWREFPQSRPAVGLAWTDAWTILYARLHAGCTHAVRDLGGHRYEFVRLECDSTMRYRNFRMYSHLTLVAKNDEGEVVRMTWLRGAVERQGRCKIYSTDD